MRALLNERFMKGEEVEWLEELPQRQQQGWRAQLEIRLELHEWLSLKLPTHCSSLGSHSGL